MVPCIRSLAAAVRPIGWAETESVAVMTVGELVAEELVEPEEAVVLEGSEELDVGVEVEPPQAASSPSSSHVPRRPTLATITDTGMPYQDT
jgi:hypothetical protein